MRSPEDIKDHYLIEKALAERLRRAEPEKRAQLYGEVYDELFRTVPNHPQLLRKEDPDERASAVAERLALLKSFIGAETVFLEIGAGDCSLTSQVAKQAKKSYALDVSAEILNGPVTSKMERVRSDGCSIPITEGTVTLAYSYQVMEHIHPDDAVAQLRNIFSALAESGRYLCITPNRLNGPHDVSQYFDKVASGFHLKEYTWTELAGLFDSIGFRRNEAYVGFSHRYFRVPLFLLVGFEKVLSWLPHGWARRLGRARGIQNLLFISLVAIK